MTLAEYLAEYAADVVREWMRIVELPDSAQAHVRHFDDGTFTLDDSPYDESHGHFRLVVTVEELDRLPPIGPEDDGALRAELAERSRSSGFCNECIEGDEDPRAWCDCREDEMCMGPCRNRAHLPEHCPNRVADPLPPQPVWQEATFLYIEPEDDIRIPGSTDTADVISVVREALHANVRSRLMPSGKWWDEIAAWEHMEVRASLAVNGGEPTGLIQYPSDTPVEILCTPERAAQLTLARAFLGTTKIGEK